MGFVHALIGNNEEAVDAFHKALGICRDDTFSTTMLSYVIEQLSEDTPPFQGIISAIVFALTQSSVMMCIGKMRHAVCMTDITVTFMMLWKAGIWIDIVFKSKHHFLPYRSL